MTQASRFGWGNSGTFLIQRGGGPFAVLGICHLEENFFDSETVDLFRELATDISFALDNFNRKRDRWTAQTALRGSEQHFRAYFDRSMVSMAASRPDRTLYRDE